MDEKLINAIKSLYKVNLGIKKGEKVLVFTDTIRFDENISAEERRRRERLLETARITAEVGKGFTSNIIYTEYEARGFHGVEPPDDMWKTVFGTKIYKEMVSEDILIPLLDKKATDDEKKRAEEIVSNRREETVDVVIALSNFSTSHTKFRDLLNKHALSRYASMPLFDPDMFYGPMDIDWDTLYNETVKLGSLFRNGNMIFLSAPNGTDLSFGIKNRRIGIDTGILREPGSFSNLPAGEIFLAPVEGTAEGSLVIEWAPTHKLGSPIKLKIMNGKVVEITGKDRYTQILSEKLNEDPNHKNIAELGIGTNPEAKRPDNILEAEKILGSIHIALGDNSSFGGMIRTNLHQDYVVFKPSLKIVYANGRERVILRQGSGVGD